MHHTKDKGDLAVAATMFDLAKKGYAVLTPTISEHLPFDIVAYKDGKFYRIQCKYIGDSQNHIPNKTSWSDKNGTHTKKYDKSDFDYYAVYYHSIEKVVYPSISFGGCTIRTEHPNSPTPFYWWEDFQNFTDAAVKKSYKDFGYEISKKMTVTEAVLSSRLKSRKVIRPLKEELEKMVWERPMTQLAKEFNVSDRSIKKWCKSYNILCPAIGYWSTTKKQAS